MRFSTAALAVTLLVWTASGPGIGAQAGGDQAVVLGDVPGGAKGTLRLPTTPARPPVVLLVAAEDTAGTMFEVVATLTAEGVASLRIDEATAETAAQWISWLRNDGRFPTVTVLGQGRALNAAVVAARAARADGVVTRGDTSAASAEIARLKARLDAATDSAGIAAFARSVPVLGRRGAPLAARPANPRRSPRHTIMASVGSTRVAIEWGSPQMRAREVWGGLVKWDEIWMPGADEATTLTTNGPISIGTIDLPAGDYTIYTSPTADRLELIVSRDVGQFHTVKNENLFIGRVPMTLKTTTESVEGLTFAIDATASTGALKLIWATREYSAPVSVK